ncbi:MAG: M23 family metallopeptidase [Symploca sp. SIO2E9]|nr:M23 family metallopeptidase [Symploca sp. SIO2E9]
MNKLIRVLITIAFAVGVFIAAPGIAFAQTWQDFTWPLCGRIHEDTSSSWSSGNPCPSERMDNALYTDFPIHHGFGYRNFTDSSKDISFHRGIDLATPLNSSNNPIDNPVFAAADGYVKSIDIDERDSKIVLLHPANGAEQCSNSNPCRISIYDHVSNVLIEEEETNQEGDLVPVQVNKGDHIAWTGTSTDGNFPHLHFEIRDPFLRASEAGKTTSGRFSYAKDAQNAMYYLPYPALTDTEPFTINISETPSLGDVDVWVSLDANPGYNLNLKSVTLNPFYRVNSGALQERNFVDQSVKTGTYVKEYVVNSNIFSMNDLSVQNTPFPSSSSKWNKEKDENSYFDGVYPGSPDALLENNADGSITNGHRYADFDYKLMTAASNNTYSSTSTGSVEHEWYQLQIGFTGIENAPSGTDRCYDVVVTTEHPQQGDHQQTAERCFNP